MLRESAFYRKARVLLFRQYAFRPRSLPYKRKRPRDPLPARRRRRSSFFEFPESNLSRLLCSDECLVFIRPPTSREWRNARGLAGANHYKIWRRDEYIGKYNSRMQTAIAQCSSLFQSVLPFHKLIIIYDKYSGTRKHFSN